MSVLTELFSTPVAGGNDVQNIVLFAAILLIGTTAAKLVHIFSRGYLRDWAARTDNTFDDALIQAVETPIYYALIGITIRASLYPLVLPELLHTVGGNIVTVVVTVFITWGITRVIDAVRMVFINPFVEASETKLDDQLVPIADKTLKAIVWCLAILIVFSNLGYDILSLLTGLGIGGLAVAMAAQATLSNLIGSVTIFADQPFQVDDLITVGDHTGVVTHVGLRACRISTMEGYKVTIPNAFVVDQAVVNRTIHNAWRQEATIGLVYSSTAAQLEQAMEILGEIFAAHPQIQPGHKVWFRRFADSALELSYAYLITDPSVDVYLQTQSEVNLVIKQQFDAAGLSMAFPSVSLYVERT